MLFPKSILRIQILLPVRVVRIRIHFTNITDHFTVESALYENSQVEEKLRKFKYCRLEQYDNFIRKFRITHQILA